MHFNTHINHHGNDIKSDENEEKITNDGDSIMIKKDDKIIIEKETILTHEENDEIAVENENKPKRSSESMNRNGTLLSQTSSLSTKHTATTNKLLRNRFTQKSNSIERSEARASETPEEYIDKQILEQKRNRTIRCLKKLTITTLVAAAVLVASLTYTFSRNSETRVFETQYYDSVTKVSETISLDISNKLNTAKTFSAIYTSRYGPERKWPNVTMPNFQEQAKGQLEVAKGVALSFNPIITTETRAEWEAHAAESANLLGAEQLYERDCDDCRVVADGIFRKKVLEDGTRVSIDDPGHSPESRYPYHMVPVWQIYPTKQNWRAVMFNLHSELHRQRALDDMLEHHVPTITGLLHLVQHDEMDPSSILFYPVFNNFSVIHKEVEGSISIVFTWLDILGHVLPDYIKGLIVVLEKSVGKDNEKDQQTYTYKISGKDVTLLGEGDMHESEFDEYVHKVDANVAQEAKGLGIADFLVTYNLRIYPSKEFKNEYVTIRPLAMTLVVLFMFILTSGIFLLYDYLVDNRQNRIIESAQRSGRIVNSMFPSTVRERIFKSSEQHHQLVQQTTCDENLGKSNASNPSKQANKRNPARHIKQFLRSSLIQKSKLDYEHLDAQGYIQSTPPIADLFQNTTIMFADMVAFTEWSSNRSPEDVFYLLETLFLEFDKAAERMGVFKLGTIGDCYIAVTGVPDLMEDHAVVLCEFAHECRKKTNEVISSLQQDFGSSVNSLNMRFGLHSGPVTAGVLRGLKSRFELFGDTINTASRMESTGAPNKIHISVETAQCLSDRGHNAWFQEREDLVEAKGKGTLQTYWLEIPESENC